MKNGLYELGDCVELISTGQRVTIGQGQLPKSNVVIIELETGHQLQCAKDLVRLAKQKEKENGMVSK